MADRRKEFESLDPALQKRIKRTLRISGVWFGLVVLGAGVFVACKPYLDKKRLERESQPGYQPKVTLKERKKRLPKNQDN